MAKEAAEREGLQREQAEAEDRTRSRPPPQRTESLPQSGQHPSGANVRWRIVFLLAGFSIVGYVVRVNITVAAEPIMREFGLSSVQLGWIFSAFLLSYTALNMPSGAWADRWGSRRILAAAGLSWFALTILTAWLPGRILPSLGGVLGILLVLRLLLGICEAPTYSSAARAIADWLPVPERALANGLVMGAALLGSAVTGPAISALVVHAGWRTAMAASSLETLPLVGIWWIYARDHPQQHRGVSLKELEAIGNENAASEGSPRATGAWKDLLRSRQAWTLSFIYACQTYLGYLFIWWCYIYLVEVRHFSLIRGGFASAAPFVLATFTTPIGGALSDRLIAAFGWRRGRQIVPMAALSAAGILASVGVRVGNGNLAVAVLSVGAALGWMCEGPTWAAMMDIARPMAGAAGGFLNTGGNIGGIFAALLTPWIAKEISWTAAFGAATFLALMGAALWTRFDPKCPVVPRHRQEDFEELEASQLFCPTCKRAMPVRKRLFLVLFDKEIYNYLCTGCGSAVGKREQPPPRHA